MIFCVFTKKASSNLSACEWNVNIYEKARILIFQCFERKHSKFDRNLLTAAIKEKNTPSHKPRQDVMKQHRLDNTRIVKTRVIDY